MLEGVFATSQFVNGAHLAKAAFRKINPDATEKMIISHSLAVAPLTDMFHEYSFRLDNHVVKKGEISLLKAAIGMRRPTYDVVSFTCDRDPSLRLYISQRQDARSVGVRLTYRDDRQWLQYTRTPVISKLSSNVKNYDGEPVQAINEIQECVVNFLQQTGSPLFQRIYRSLLEKTQGIEIPHEFGKNNF